MRVFAKGIGALALLAVILAAAVEAVGFMARQIGHQIFHGIDPTVASAAVAAMSTIIVAVATLVLGRYFERSKAIEAEIRASKVPCYSKLVTGLLKLLRSTPGPGQQAAAEEFFNDLTPDLINWASDDVLVAWSKFKRNIQNHPDMERVFDLEQVLLAIRKDYGHKGRKIVEGDLLGLFVTDIDEQLAKRRGSVNSGTAQTGSVEQVAPS
jgi:hypothetical protein